MIGKIIDFEAYLPHDVFEAICTKCLHRYMCVKPVDTWLKDLECPKCGSKGYVIQTGQELEEKE